MRRLLYTEHHLVSNIAMTLGGYWHEDNRKNVDNWKNDPKLAGAVSYEPKRVPKVSCFVL